MQILSLLACLLLFPAAPQEDPFETHLYNVEFLTASTADFPGHGLGLSWESVGTAVAASELDRGLLSGEDLVNLIKTNVSEDSWEHVSTQLSFARGVLTATNRKSVHAKIAQYLNYWRGFFGKMIVLDAAMVSIDPQFLARIRSAGNPERPAILPAEQYRQLLETAREGKLGEILTTKRITAHPGQRVNLQELSRQSFIRDYDVQIGTGAVALDPVVDVLTTGTSLDVAAFLEPFANGVTLVVRGDASDPEAVETRKMRIPREVLLSTPLGGEPAKAPGAALGPNAAVSADVPIQLPRITLDSVRTTLTVRNRESAIVGSVLRKGRLLLFLLTPTIIASEEKPAPEPVFEEQRLLRLFDISPLTRGVQDWSGPLLDLHGPSGGIGSMTGAAFTLNEPAMLMSSVEVAALIRTRIAPDSWGNKRNSIDDTQSGTLIVRQKPEVLREIEALLATLLTARAQMITTEVVVIGFRKGSRAEWEKSIPALAPGGYSVESEPFDKLLEEAYKGQAVRLVETAEITGFPQQRVYALRCQQELYVQDFEPQVSTYAFMMDPIVGLFSPGFVLDVRPRFVHGGEQIEVEFRSTLVQGQVKDVDGPNGLQAAAAKVLRWNASVLCLKGRYSLVAIETQGRGEAAEDLAVFVRARRNVLK